MQIQIPIPGINKTTSAINYNLKEKMLYVWDSGVATRYTLHFDSDGILNAPSVSPHPIITPPPSTIKTTPNLSHPTLQDQGT